MSQYDTERLEAILLSLRDQVDVLGDRLDALRGEQTQRFNRLEAMVTALRPRVHAPLVGRPTYPSTQGPSRGSGSESLA